MNSLFLMLAIFFITLLFNAIFSGYETGFVSCNPIRVRHLAEKEKQAKARYLLDYLNRPDRMIVLLLVGTNLALIAGTMALTRQLGPTWATIIATPTILILGEVIPKSIFRVHPTRLSLGFVPLIRLFDYLLAPVVAPITWLSQRALDLVKGEPQGMRMFMRSPEDMRVLVDEGADRGAIEPEEKEMIHSVMDLQHRYAKEVMVPRIDVHALPEDATRNELIASFMDSGYTRIPIYRDTVDEIIGFINAFEVLKDEHPESEDIHRFIRPAMHVGDTMKLDDLLQAMRDQKQSMAIVTDEYGGTDGLITLEDIFEEIFGEIHDEYDEEEPSVRRVGPNEYVIQARTTLDAASEAMGIEIADEAVETVGGWIMHMARAIPQKGEVVEFGRFRITVLEGTVRQIGAVRLEVLPEPGSQPAKGQARL